MVMPVALTNRTLMHALLACSGTPYAHRDTELRPSYLTHYNKAVTGLLNTLQRHGPRSEEWIQSTILLLHIFEVGRYRYAYDYIRH